MMTTLLFGASRPWPKRAPLSTRPQRVAATTARLPDTRAAAPTMALPMTMQPSSPPMRSQPRALLQRRRLARRMARTQPFRSTRRPLRSSIFSPRCSATRSISWTGPRSRFITNIRRGTLWRCKRRGLRGMRSAWSRCERRCAQLGLRKRKSTQNSTTTSHGFVSVSSALCCRRASSTRACGRSSSSTGP